MTCNSLSGRASGSDVPRAEGRRQQHRVGEHSRVCPARNDDHDRVHLTDSTQGSGDDGVFVRGPIGGGSQVLQRSLLEVSGEEDSDEARRLREAPLCGGHGLVKAVVRNGESKQT